MRQITCTKEQTKDMITRISHNDPRIRSIVFQSVNVEELKELAQAMTYNRHACEIKISLTPVGYCLSSSVEHLLWQQEDAIEQVTSRNAQNLQTLGA